MNKLRVLSVLVLLTVTLFAIGCGGGGASSVAVEKDVVGITRTLGDFMAAARAGDQAKLQSLMASSGEYYLMVKDFGVDITDPDDNQSYEFYVNPDLISQPSADVAYVYAYYKLRSGETLWLYFEMAREDGRWVIEEMASKAPTAGGYVEPTNLPTAFVVANYRPINSDIKKIFSVENSAGQVSTNRAIVRYVDKTTEGEITFYKQEGLEVDPNNAMYNGFGALRAQTGTTGTTGTTSGVELDEHYGVDRQQALWLKVTDRAGTIRFNNDQPVKLLEPSQPFGSKRVVKYFYEIGGAKHFINITIDIGYPMTTGFETPLKTYNSVVPVTIVEANETTNEVEKRVEYYAPGVGEVGYDELDNASTLTEKNRLITRFNDAGSLNERNDPIITNTNTNLGSYEVGQKITSMQVTASGGTGPLTYRWFGGTAAPVSMISDIALSTGGLLSGRIDGNPPAGSSSGKVEVVDKYGRHANKEFTVTVVNAAGVIFSTVLKDVDLNKTLEASIIIGGTTVLEADYFFTFFDFTPVGETGYISFSAETGTGIAKIAIFGKTEAETIKFKVRATKKADNTVYESHLQAVTVGPAL